MPFDGYGTFLRLRSWVVDATNSVKIRADFHDAEDNNFAAGLSQCIAKDGQTAITQNIPFNSRRIVSLADPIDPQDAATKDYADTKMPLDGSKPITGDVIIKEDSASLTLDGKAGFKNSIYGQKGDKNRWEIVLGNATAEAGADAGSDFELVNYHDDGTLIGDVLFGKRSTGLVTVKGDPTAALGIATKQMVDTKLPLTGGTITGSLIVNGNINAAGNVLTFGSGGSNAYLQWNGGGTYTLGNGGTVWHSGNFSPGTQVGTVTGARWIFNTAVALPYNDTTTEYPNGVVTSVHSRMGVSGGIPVYQIDYIGVRALQLQTTPGNWFTVGYFS